MSGMSKSTASMKTAAISYQNRPVSAKYHIVQNNPTDMKVEVTYDPHLENQGHQPSTSFKSRPPSA